MLDRRAAEKVPSYDTLTRDVSVPTSARAGSFYAAHGKARTPSPTGLLAALASSITVLALMGAVMEGNVAYRVGSLGLPPSILRSVNL